MKAPRIAVWISNHPQEVILIVSIFSVLISVYALGMVAGVYACR